MVNGFVGDVNLENRLHKAARNIPQPQQMRAYSTTSHASNALRKSRPSRRTPLVSSARSYATQTTNPNPPFGRFFAINPSATFYLRLILLQVPRTAPIKRLQKLPLLVSVAMPSRPKSHANRAQAPGVTPGKVGNAPDSWTHNRGRQTRLKCDKPRSFLSTIRRRVANCKIIISLDQSSQCTSTYGFTSCERSS